MSAELNHSYTRERGAIKSVLASRDYEGRGPVISIEVEFRSGTQAFQGCVPADRFDSFASGVCATFGVDALTDLRGLDCYALRSWPSPFVEIEGLEALSGKRFTKTKWARGEGLLQGEPLAVVIQAEAREIVKLEARLSVHRDRLSRLLATGDGFVDWEKEGQEG